LGFTQDGFSFLGKTANIGENTLEKRQIFVKKTWKNG
jgi:hypothetical protein